MKLNQLALIGLAALAATNAQAANQNFNVPYRMALIQDGQLIHQNLHRAYGFRVEILNDDEGVKPETFKNGRPSITATKGERYSVRLFNPLPVEVAVNLTVDGLNSITGKPSGIADGKKWIIEPYSSITIPGWQITGGEARRFFFTEKPKSYAQWRGDVTGKDLSANCGVIGAAYFWNQQELDAYYDSHPLYRNTQGYNPYSEYPAKSKYDFGFRSDDLLALGAAPSAAGSSTDGVNCDIKCAPLAVPQFQAQVQAGTGMGERESHPTTEVDFSYNTGMYSLDQAVVIYYDFAQAPSPNPFPAEAYAPEMR